MDLDRWQLASLARHAIARGNGWTHVVIERGRIRWLQLVALAV